MHMKFIYRLPMSNRVNNLRYYVLYGQMEQLVLFFQSQLKYVNRFIIFITLQFYFLLLF